MSLCFEALTRLGYDAIRGHVELLDAVLETSGRSVRPLQYVHTPETDPEDVGHDQIYGDFLPHRDNYKMLLRGLVWPGHLVASAVPALGEGLESGHFPSKFKPRASEASATPTNGHGKEVWPNFVLQEVIAHTGALIQLRARTSERTLRPALVTSWGISEKNCPRSKPVLAMAWGIPPLTCEDRVHRCVGVVIRNPEDDPVVCFVGAAKGVLFTV